MKTITIKNSSIEEFSKSRWAEYDPRIVDRYSVLHEIAADKPIVVRKCSNDSLAIYPGDVIVFEISEKTQITKRQVTTKFEYHAIEYDDICLMLVVPKPITEDKKEDLPW